jgi:prepilin-type processing-associated H-X9-DG protein
VLVNSIDYAGNGGSYAFGYDPNATDGTTLNGVFQGVNHVVKAAGGQPVLTTQVVSGRPLRFSDVMDGLSNTMLVGEKAVNSLTSLNNNDGTWGDDEGYVFGVAWDTIRFGQGATSQGTFASIPFSDAWGNPATPVQDQPCPANFSGGGYPPDFPGWPNYRWGSAHSGAMNVAFCDGSVRIVKYNIDLGVLSYLCARNDGKVFTLD